MDMPHDYDIYLDKAYLHLRPYSTHPFNCLMRYKTCHFAFYSHL